MNAIQKAVHNLGESLTALGKHCTEEAFVFWAKESQDKKYVESHIYHKFLELRLAACQQIDISEEVARALLESDSFLCEMLHGYENFGGSTVSYWAKRTEYGQYPANWLLHRKYFKLILN